MGRHRPRDVQGQDQRLQCIAEVFLEEWRKAHGRTGDRPRALLLDDVLTVVIHNALTAGEKNLVDKPGGGELIQRYFEQLMDQVYPALACAIESKLGGYLAQTGITVDAASGSIHFAMWLRMPARAK